VSSGLPANPRRRIYTRRRFLVLSGAAGAFLAGCGGGDAAQVQVRYGTPTGNSPRAGDNGDGSPVPTGTPIPPPDVIMSTDAPHQGGTVLVSVVGAISGGVITFLDRAYPLTQGQQSLYAFVGVDADDPTGDHALRIDFTLVNGSQGNITEAVRVQPTGWDVDHVQLGPSQTNLLDPKVTEAELAELMAVYSQRSGEKLWSQGWALPIDGPLTTRFGEQRSYNGGPVSGHHGGTDIGAAEGAPVGACNSGRVVMARQLQVRGNMVVVDHGGGLFSGYAHLSQLSVAEGQLVGQGSPVGLVGSTGLSTGAHLHWEMATGGVLVDALRFTDGTNGF
jgi:murein DD-endopeptidase MepM/ murein hydrolase activator NlpD